MCCVQPCRLAQGFGIAGAAARLEAIGNVRNVRKFAAIAHSVMPCQLYRRKRRAAARKADDEYRRPFRDRLQSRTGVVLSPAAFTRCDPRPPRIARPWLVA